MGRSYSLDLRSRVVAFVEAGQSRRAAARHFGVSESFAIKLLRRVAVSGSPALVRQGRAPGYGRLEPHAGFLVGAVEGQPDITMPELSAALLQAYGIEVDPAVLSRFLCRRGFTYKKSPDGRGARTCRHPRRSRHLDQPTSAAHA
jgi:transposase